MPRFYESLVRPLAPQTAPLPISDRHAAPPPTQSLPGHFAQPDGFCAPAKVIPAIVAAVTVAMWTPMPAATAQPQEYDRGSFVAPDKVAAAASPATISGWTGDAAVGGKAFRFSWPEGFTAPPKLFPPAAVTLNHWTPTIAPPAVALPHAPGDSFSSPAKTLPPAAVTLNHWTPTIGANAQPQEYDRGSYAAPDKFGIAAPAVVSLEAWLGEVAPPAKQFLYLRGDVFSAPDRVLPPAAVTLNHWMPAAATISLSSPHLQPAASAAPEKVLAPAAPPNVFWLREVPAVMQTPRFAAADICSPPRIPAGIGPATIGALGAQVRASMESLSAAMRPVIDAQFAAVRASMESLSAAMRPAIDAQFAAIRPAIDSLGAIVRPS